MNEIAVFVYKKEIIENIILVLNHEEAEDRHDELIKDGYKHIATLEPSIYISNVLKNNPKLLKELNNE